MIFFMNDFKEIDQKTCCICIRDLLQETCRFTQFDFFAVVVSNDLASAHPCRVAEIDDYVLRYSKSPKHRKINRIILKQTDNSRKWNT